MVSRYFEIVCMSRPYLSYPKEIPYRELLENVDQDVSIHISQDQPGHGCSCREEKRQMGNRR